MSNAKRLPKQQIEDERTPSSGGSKWHFDLAGAPGYSRTTGERYQGRMMMIAVDDDGKTVGAKVAGKSLAPAEVSEWLEELARRHGLPEAIVVDNSRDFQSLEFQKVIDSLGLQLEYYPTTRPHHRGKVERAFRNFVADECVPTKPRGIRRERRR